MKWLRKLLRWLLGNSTEGFHCCAGCHQVDVCRRMGLCADELSEETKTPPREKQQP